MSILKIVLSIFLLLNLSGCYTYYTVKESDLKIAKTQDGEIHLQNSKLLYSGDNGLVIKGALVNNTNKIIKSMDLKIDFLDEFGLVVHTENLKTKKDINLKSKYYVVASESYDQIQDRNKIKDFNLKVNSIAHYPKYILSILKPEKNDLTFFENDVFKIIFYFDYKEIAFKIKNKINTPIEINWDKSSYVDLDSYSHRILHTGIKFNEKEKTMVNSIISPFSNFADVVIPENNVFYADEKWDKLEFLSSDSESAKLSIGKQMGLLLNLKIENKEQNLFFEFNVDSIDKL
jgi:hypothetical protein